MQLPMDLQIYQELIFRNPPSVVVQTGIASGGSLLYFASMLDLIGAGKDVLVIGVDIEISDWARKLNHPRVRMIRGDSLAESTIGEIRKLAGDRLGMVSLDSDHSKAHVLNEMRIYKQFVQPGHYLVVEDTNMNGHPVLPHFGPGPFEAVEEFLRENHEFCIDDGLWERNFISFHHHGWLKRIQ